MCVRASSRSADDAERLAAFEVLRLATAVAALPADGLHRSHRACR